MLEDYKEKEPIVYRILNQEIANSKCSHAYLFEISNEEQFNIIMAFVKSIVCPSNKFACSKSDCNICDRIDNGNYPEITVIEPDGMWIKKEQLVSLQQDFSKKAIEGNTKIYIIKECEKLNKTSANSILKFLEEPEDGIIAILVTKNSNMVIKTIVSRCQQIRFQNKINNNIIYDEELSEVCMKFVSSLETKGFNAITDINELTNSVTKSSLNEVFTEILNIYEEILNYMMTRKIKKYNRYETEINKIMQRNSIAFISKKVQIILDTREQLQNNLNIGLVFDKFLIRMEVDE